jgi:hypothetical protein
MARAPRVSSLIMGDTAAYLYCLVKSAARPSMRGVPDGVPGAARPEAHAISAGLWAIAAGVPLDRYGAEPLTAALRDLDWVSHAALAHEAVVEHFSRRRGVTALPMKMFTMFSTAERAVQDLRGRRRSLLAVFKRIEGAEEWGVRIALDPRPAGDGAARPAAAGGAAFLAAKKAARDRVREAAWAAAEAAEAGFATLDAVARASSRRDDVPAGATAPPLLDAAFLVPIARRARFKAAAKAWAATCRRAGARMTLTGPWPAYSFAHPAEPRR